jgi:hypothetical protein
LYELIQFQTINYSDDVVFFGLRLGTVLVLSISSPGAIPSNSPFNERFTILNVKDQTRAKTNACVNATTILDPLGGREIRIPGVKTKKRINA